MKEEAAIQEVVDASRILSMLGLVDAFGHVSRRHPEHSDRFLMSRTMAPGLVTPGDVVEHDLAGHPVGSPDTKVFLERFIHSEIYRKRADVHAVVHSHAPGVLPFTVVDVPLQPVMHTCGFLHPPATTFDIADQAGDASDLLVRDPALGRSLAAKLGDASVILMRGHGFTAVGATVAEAVYRAHYTDLNCRVLAAALAIGTPKPLSAAEAEACERTTGAQSQRAWDLWAAMIERARPG